MGIPLDIFSLHLLRGEAAACRHFLLTRVGRPAFGNADQGDYERAVDAADEKRRSLIEGYEARMLAVECGVRHSASLAGELQAHPVGDELSEGRGGRYVELWVAGTRFGHPWVVMGTAESEEEFWREVEQDEDLMALSPSAPAERRRAYFLTDEEETAREGG